MNTLDLILALVTALLGCSTFMGWLFYRRANRRKKDAEAREQESKARTQEINNEQALRDVYESAIRDLREEHAERTKELRATIADVNLMYHNAIKDGARKDNIIEDKTAKIRSLNETVYELQQTIIKKDNFIAARQRYIDFLKLWHCERELPMDGMSDEEISKCCTRRLPPHSVPVKYKPFKENSND